MALRISLLALAACAAALGCTITTYKQNPGEHDRGFRYYRPKPYLFIQPAGGDTNTNAPEFVSIEMRMMPDFSDMVSVHTRAGLGVNTTKLEITDGWNLTKVTQELDSKTDENIKAIGGLVKSAVALVPSGGAAVTDKRFNATQRNVLPARNVPLGFYEAVINRDDCGVKRLAGFRYIGFMPYAPCPVVPHGGEAQCCQQGEIYGLVNEGGLTVFKRLDAIAAAGVGPYVESTVPAPLTRESLQKRLDALNGSALLQRLSEQLPVQLGVSRCSLIADGPGHFNVELTVTGKPDVKQFNADRTRLEAALTARLNASVIDELKPSPVTMTTLFKWATGVIEPESKMP